MPDQLYQHIYLSPHLDDAALSCGGRIFQACQVGLSVLVLTTMAGDPPSETPETPYLAGLHTRWKLETQSNPIITRRVEDKQAMSVLGAATLHWEWPDCIYRRHPQTGEFFYTSDSDLFGPIHPAEKPLIEVLAQRLGNLPLAPGGRVYAPLTVGRHVDHQIVRQTAEINKPPMSDLIYYEEYPYGEQPDALATVLEDDRAWQAELVPLDETTLIAKTDAVACYRSQLSTFFTGREEMARRLQTYAAIVSGGKGWAERYWYPNISSEHQTQSGPHQGERR